MSLEVLQLGFLALTSLIFLVCYFKFQKPLAGFLAATLFLVLGFQLVINGYSLTLYSTSVPVVNTTFTYTTFIQNASVFSSGGVLQNFTITNVSKPIYSNQTVDVVSTSVSFQTVRDDFTNFTGLVFVLLGLFLTLISGVEIVTKKSRTVS